MTCDQGTGAGADGIAWWVESQARCDIVEYPNGLAESKAIEVWTDAAGRRISSQLITPSTSRGGGDCLEKGARTLLLDNGDSEDSVRYLGHGEAYPNHVAEPFRADVPLFADAVDSGYRHGVDRLCFSPHRERAYVGGLDRVELWPR